MKRQTRRRTIETYTDFPDHYITLVERFANLQHLTLGPMPKSSALSFQFQFGKWRGFLRRAPPDDEHARDLLAIAQTMQCSRLPVDNAPDQVILDWHLDPITQFMQGGST